MSNKSHNYRDIKNFLHNDVGFTRALIEEMAEKYADEKMEKFINRRFNDMVASGEFDRRLDKLIDAKIKHAIEQKVSSSLRWGGLKIDVKVLPEKKIKVFLAQNKKD